MELSYTITLYILDIVCYTFLTMSTVDGEVAIDATTVVEPKQKKVVKREETVVEP